MTRENFQRAEALTAGLPQGITRHHALNVVADWLGLLGCGRGPVNTYLSLAMWTATVDWTTTGSPLNYRKQYVNAQELGITEKTLRNHERILEGYGVIEKRTPGNGARGLAPRGGAEIGHGISFAPTVERFPSIAAEVERMRQSRQEWEAARRRLMILKPTLMNRVEMLHEAAPAHELLEEAAALEADLPSPRAHDRVGTGELAAANAEIEELLSRIEEALEVIHRAVDNLAEESKSAEIISLKLPDPPEKSSTCPYNNTNPQKSVFVPSQPKNPKNQSSSSAESGQSGTNDPAHPRESQEFKGLPLAVSGQELVEIMSDDLKLYFDVKRGQAPHASTAEILALACIWLSRDLGINPSAWEEAEEVLGRNGAALAVAIIDRNRFHPEAPVRKPGGVLRAMVRQHRDGQLRLDLSMNALLRRHRSGQQPKDWVRPPSPENPGGGYGEV